MQSNIGKPVHEDLSTAKAREWCSRHTDWQMICDIPDHSIFEKKYAQMPAEVRKHWDEHGGEAMWEEFGTGEYTVEVGHVGASGNFYASILNAPVLENTMMVFRTGRESKP